MVSLEGTQTGANLKHAFAEAGRFDRRYLNQERAAEAEGLSGFAALARAAAANGARFASGHLDFLVADTASVTPSGFAAEMKTMIDDHTAMYAAMARTARDEGFEDIADWFETLAKAGRSHARRLRQAVDKRASKT
jgi:rubrerythrin